MRIIISFKSLSNFPYDEIGKYTIQGLIYGFLVNTRFSKYHTTKGFKFFNFSNIFPVKDFDENHNKTLIISSPNTKFIKTIYHSLKANDEFYLGKRKMIIKDIKMFDSNFNNKFISSTPIVLYQNNQSNLYYSFEKNPDFNFFFERLKENSIKKYNAFYNEELSIEGAIFDSFEFSREVSVRLRKNTKDFVIIGSIWKNLEKNDLKNYKKFYKFLLDFGL
ncbi:MAG: CRISPR-associated endoribonuclease Cas6 [Methanobrevibacter sp.]|jgi:CRISPR-associated endoribonuclease Cas6|nr:CRISPR-associated endoribonuclease Cas6 [Methanobrevibacter sp.]